MSRPSKRPELVLNNPDAAKLYNWIHNMPAPHLNTPTPQTKSGSSAVFNIQHLDINGVQNPAEFAREFEKNINRYWQTKLTESKVK